MLWRDGDFIVLACQGIPGAGKTTLASLIVDSLRGDSQDSSRTKQQTQGTDVAGIYCSYGEPHPIANMIGSVLRQLLEPLEPDSARATFKLQNVLTLFSRER